MDFEKVSLLNTKIRHCLRNQMTSVQKAWRKSRFFVKIIFFLKVRPLARKVT